MFVNYHKKIIRLMEFKQKKILDAILNSSKIDELSEVPTYFDNYDEMNLMDVPKKEIKKVYNDIKNELEIHKKLSVLSSETCPFCKIYCGYDCDGCTYAENHGLCDDEDSDFYKLFGIFEEIGDESLYITYKEFKRL